MARSLSAICVFAAIVGPLAGPAAAQSIRMPPIPPYEVAPVAAAPVRWWESAAPRGGAPAQTAPRDDWSRVAALVADQRVVIQPVTGRKVVGRFVAADGDSLTLNIHGFDERFTRQEVRSVSAIAPGRQHFALWGALIGGGISGTCMGIKSANNNFRGAQVGGMLTCGALGAGPAVAFGILGAPKKVYDRPPDASPASR